MKPTTLSPTLRQVIRDVVADTRTKTPTDAEVADYIIKACDGALPIYEDVYEQLADMIEPYVSRDGTNEDGAFPASVVETVQILLEHYLRSPKHISDKEIIKFTEKWFGEIPENGLFNRSRFKNYFHAILENPSFRTELALDEAVAWRWSESNGERWFDWTTDWSYHDKAVEFGCLIEYAYSRNKNEAV